MAAVFPSSPTNNQVVVVGGVSFIYNSTDSVWNQMNTANTSPTLTNAQLDGLLSGSGIKDEDDMVSNSDDHISTQQSIKAYVDAGSHARPFGSLTTIVVQSLDKTSKHRYNGTGSAKGYFMDGIESPYFVFTPGRTYRFDTSHSTNATHGIRFFMKADKTSAYTTNVTQNGTPGNAGAYTEILITDDTPPVLHYQCENHAYMGNAIQTNTSNLTGVTISYNDLSNKPSIPTALTDLSISDGSANMVLKTDGSGNFGFTSISSIQSAGISNVVEDTTPQLGGPVDFKSLSSNPSSNLAAGQVYYNSDTKKLMLYDGSDWVEVSGSASSQPFLTRQVITHGFVMGGYQSSSPWKNVNTMVHATDVMTNNGDVMTYAAAYTSGVCTLTHGYLWSADDTWPGTSASTSNFHMSTYSGSNGPNLQWGRNDCATLFKEHEKCWVVGGGSANIDVMNLSNATMYTDQGQDSLSGDSMQAGCASHSGENYGYVWQATDDCRKFVWSTSTQVTMTTPSNKPGINSQQKGWADKLGYGYAGNEGTYNGGDNVRVWSYTTESVTSTVTKPITNCGEENLDMGQAHQYSMGNYDGAQNNRGWKWTYATNSGSELGSGSIRTGVPGGSLGHCVWRG